MGEKPKVQRNCVRVGCKRKFQAVLGTGRGYCSAYCRKMNLRNRPARDMEAPREWSLDRREVRRIDEIHAKQAAAIRAKARVLVRDGEAVGAVEPTKAKDDEEPSGC